MLMWIHISVSSLFFLFIPFFVLMQTVGSTKKSAFQSRQRMTHNLTHSVVLEIGIELNCQTMLHAAYEISISDNFEVEHRRSLGDTGEGGGVKVAEHNGQKKKLISLL